MHEAPGQPRLQINDPFYNTIIWFKFGLHQPGGGGGKFQTLRNLSLLFDDVALLASSITDLQLSLGQFEAKTSVGKGRIAHSGSREWWSSSILGCSSWVMVEWIGILTDGSAVSLVVNPIWVSPLWSEGKLSDSHYKWDDLRPWDEKMATVAEEKKGLPCFLLPMWPRPRSVVGIEWWLE